MYSEAQLKELRQILAKFNLFMGYTDSYKAEDDPTLFFKYEEGEIE